MDENVSGTVKWFNTNKGFGFILTDDNREVFVHYSEILSDGFRNLSEGDKVNFKIDKKDLLIYFLLKILLS